MIKKTGKILVTGGAGYIGSHVVKLLGERKENILIVDNLSTGRKDAVLSGELCIGDLSDDQFMEELFSKNEIRAVIHFAAKIVVPESVEKPLMYYANNTLNTLKLLKHCEKFKINRFIFSSTAATYGEGESDFFTETSPQIPTNPYGMSKLMSERMLSDFSKAHHHFSFIGLRYFNVAGADPEGKIGQCFPGATHLIKVSCEAALGKRSHVAVFGTDWKTKDGTGVRDYIHVTDLAQAHLDALDYLESDLGAKKESYFLNCGYGHGASVNEVIKIVRKIHGKDFEIKTQGRRAGDVGTVVAKADKIKTVLSWKPKYDDLEFIVKTAYEWEKKFKSN